MVKNIKVSTLWMLIGALLISCNFKNKKASIKRPNIVWITSEDNSKHYLELFDKNGATTPNIASIAKQGLIYTNAFSNAPVCSVARSTLISGCYAPKIGAQFHRKSVSVNMPNGLKMFPQYLREVGYYTSNNAKEDYNLIKTDQVWNDSSRKATWRNREEGQPFFHVYNIGISHEGGLHFPKEDLKNKSPITNKSSFNVQPNHPNTKVFRYTNAVYRDKIQQMDRKVGEVLDNLRNDNLLEDTFVFYFGDHGGVLPGSKGYLFEVGVHVPLVIYVPKKYKHLAPDKIGDKVSNFVSFVDFAPTILNLAGIEIPEKIDGTPFLGKNVSFDIISNNDETYSYADRFDEKYDFVRSIRSGKYKYIRNYQPFNFDGLMNNYRYKQLAFQEWKELFEKGQLNDVQSSFFKTKPTEMLFNIELDPYETENLADNIQYKEINKKLRNKLNSWVAEMPDLSFYPEHYLIDHAFDNPLNFGQTHKQDIKKYIKIADLVFQPFTEVSGKLQSLFEDADPWVRYWALITCSTFKQKTPEIVTRIKKIVNEDPEPINQVRAAEFLAFVNEIEPEEILLKALYKSKKPFEALLTLNSITLLKSKGYQFNIDVKKLHSIVLDNNQIKQRLIYLNVL